MLIYFQLKNQYKQANDTLTSKSGSSEVARERAQQLLQRASRITVDTNNKLKELRGEIFLVIAHVSTNSHERLSVQKWYQ